MDKLKIMIVDDESRMRKLVKDFLKKKNFEVVEAADGEEALDIFFNPFQGSHLIHITIVSGHMLLTFTA